MIVYVYSKCSTCQQALGFLAARKIAVTVKEIVNEPPRVAELQQMLAFQRGELKKLFNSSGMLYREMQLAERLPHMSLTDAITLLSQHGMLVKRPFLLAKDFGLLGFKEKEWSEKF